MPLPITLSEIAPRISAGAFILNSGLGKRGADEQTAAGLHGFAAGTYPVPEEPPAAASSSSLLSTSEIAVGAILLTPFVPTAVAGATLTVFSGGLLGLYLRTPGMRKPGSLAPDRAGPGHRQGQLAARHRYRAADPRHGRPAAPAGTQSSPDAGRRGHVAEGPEEGPGTASERRRLTRSVR